MHAAEDDVGGVVVVGRETRQLERVAPGVRPLDDFGALVVMAEDEQLRAERGLGGGDPLVDLLGRREGVPPTAGLSAPGLICGRNARPASA
jgi:hypothetical protein